MKHKFGDKRPATLVVDDEMLDFDGLVSGGRLDRFSFYIIDIIVCFLHSYHALHHRVKTDADSFFITTVGTPVRKITCSTVK